MSSILRKIVEKSRSKSRSKSPVKRSTKQPNQADNEFEHWTHPGDHSRPMSMGRMPPMIRTQYVDERAEVSYNVNNLSVLRTCVFSKVQSPNRRSLGVEFLRFVSKFQHLLSAKRKINVFFSYND